MNSSYTMKHPMQCLEYIHTMYCPLYGTSYYNLIIINVIHDYLFEFEQHDNIFYSTVTMHNCLLPNYSFSFEQMITKRGRIT